MPDVRQPVIFVLFYNGLTQPIEATRTPRVAISEPNRPMHLRLARTANISEMRISWTSRTNDNPRVRYPGVNQVPGGKKMYPGVS